LELARTTDDDGYAERPGCGRDYFVLTAVERDRMIAVQADGTRPGHIVEPRPAARPVADGACAVEHRSWPPAGS
jgi:hypothetical protein